ncbi:MAG TPA: ABC transporter permease subunit [Acidimicrobiia bacterium]|nr:ABC transporter permease subunit [Acidimicrobiia bacterium]
MTREVLIPNARVPFWRNQRVLRAVAQVVVAAAVLFLLYVLWFNVTNNMRARGVRTDFNFLDQPFGVRIAGSDLSPSAPVRSALLNGIRNTFALAIVGLPLLTILGVIVGVGRLSTNWLVAKISSAYVEILRNLPPLLVVIFAFQAVILRLPPARNPITPFGWFVISNLEFHVPGFRAGDNYRPFMMVMLVAVLLGALLWWWRTRVHERTGTPHHRWLWSLGTIGLVGAIAYLILDRPLTIILPRLEGRVVDGGYRGLGAFFAVVGALAFYTSSHVAEIVRGSILAVPKGQSEAASALALSGFQRLRFVVLPQAMRIALPPIINQYLNYVKNTSLAIAVGFAEVTLVAFQAIGNGQPAPQVVVLLMGSYLIFSLVISLLVNLYNRHLRIVTR